MKSEKNENICENSKIPKNPDKIALEEQVDCIMQEYRDKRISIREMLRLIDMAYGDYIENHPEELPEIDERRKLDEPYKLDS